MNFVLLRGLARDARHWGEFPDLLSEATGDSRVILVDLPGTGEHVQCAAPLCIGDTTDFLRSHYAIKLRELSYPRILVGLSLGGMVTLDWVSRFPEDFDAAVAINTSGGGIDRMWNRCRPWAVMRLIEAFACRDPFRREELILRLTSRLGSPQLARTWGEWAQAKSISRINVIRQIIAGARFQAPDHVTRPMLILSGAGDNLVHPACSKNIAERYKATQAIHPTGGHDLIVDAPQWVAQQIAFLTSKLNPGT